MREGKRDGERERKGGKRVKREEREGEVKRREVV